MATCVADWAAIVVYMAELGTRTASAFTRHVINVIAGYARRNGIRTNKQLADATGIKKSKIDRIVTFKAPVTLDELELFADAVGIPAGVILDDALDLYGGLPKLVEDLKPSVSVGSPDNGAYPETEEDLAVVDPSRYALAAETGVNEADLPGGGTDEGTAPDSSDDESDGSPRAPRR